MATLMMDATPLYPTLFPSPGEPAAYTFLPIHPPKEEEGAQQQQQQQEEEEEAGGGGMAEESLREEAREEETLLSNGQQQEQASESAPNCQEDVSEQPQQTIETRESAADADNQEQTTNGENTTCENAAPSNQDSTDHNVNQAPQCNGQTDEEIRTKLREQCVGRAWDEFVTHFLLGSCHIQKAAIFDLATRRPVAVNGNLRISTEELEQLVLSLHHLQLAYRNGVTIERKTYKVRLADGRNGILARSEREGCTVCKTHTLIIIGVHDERGNSRKCNEDVMRLGDFFRKKGV